MTDLSITEAKNIPTRRVFSWMLTYFENNSDVGIFHLTLAWLEIALTVTKQIQ